MTDTEQEAIARLWREQFPMPAEKCGDHRRYDQLYNATDVRYAFTAGYLAHQQAVAQEREHLEGDSGSVPCPHCYDGGACLPGGCGVDGCERCGKPCPTCEGTHELDATTVAKQLAQRDHQLDALRRVVARTLACGQLEKLEATVDSTPMSHAEACGKCHQPTCVCPCTCDPEETGFGHAEGCPRAVWLAPSQTLDQERVKLEKAWEEGYWAAEQDNFKRLTPNPYTKPNQGER